MSLTFDLVLSQTHNLLLCNYLLFPPLLLSDSFKRSQGKKLIMLEEIGEMGNQEVEEY